MHPLQGMPARVRAIDHRYIRLDPSLQSHVEHLARLAGVTSSDVVTFVLTEAFEESGALERPPETRATPAPVPRRQRRPADVIPIRRSRRYPAPQVLAHFDPPYLRRQAAEVLGLARALRTRADEARAAAVNARAMAAAALALARDSV